MSVRKRGARSYQVRVAGFPAQTVPTREAAERMELDLMLRRVGGTASPEPPTKLADEIDGFLVRLRAAGGLRPRSLEFYEHKAKVWKPLRSVRVSALRRAQIEDFIVARAAEHPRSALDELQFLKRVCARLRIAVSESMRRCCGSSSATTRRGVVMLSQLSSCTSWRLGSLSTPHDWCSWRDRSARGRRSGSV